MSLYICDLHAHASLRLDDLDVRAILPDLRRLLAVPAERMSPRTNSRMARHAEGEGRESPPPAEHPRPRLQVLRDDNLVRDEPDHPVARARTHAVAVAALSFGAVEHARVEGAGGGEGEAAGAASTAAAGRAAWGVRVQALPPVLDPRNLRARTETNTQRSNHNRNKDAVYLVSSPGRAPTWIPWARCPR